MSQPSRYLIGIDLGTTNSVVAYIDTAETAIDASPEIRVFDVAQVVGPGEVRAEPALPSFLYFPTESEIESGAFDLPWEERPSAIVGVAARDRGMLVPGRLVSSAKSWLCQDAVDRTAAILPREAEPPEPMISPDRCFGSLPHASAQRMEPCDACGGGKQFRAALRKPTDRSDGARVFR